MCPTRGRPRPRHDPTVAAGPAPAPPAGPNVPSATRPTRGAPDPEFAAEPADPPDEIRWSAGRGHPYARGRLTAEVRQHRSGRPRAGRRRSGPGHASEQQLDPDRTSACPHLDLDTELDRRTGAPGPPPGRRCAGCGSGPRPCSPPATQVAGDAYTAETLGRTLARRVAELADDPTTPLFFGRLTSTTTTPTSGGSYHIGRRHVTDDAGEPMVLDWRAPLSRAFYQASARDPQGVAVRRRFGFAGGDADQLRGRAPRPGRGAGHRQPDPDRRDRAPPRRADARHRRHHPARAGRAGPRRPGRDRSACRARRAPERRPSGCTAPRTCSTCTGSGCAARACWSSGRTGRSCATSRRCCRRSARSRSSSPPWTTWSPGSPVRAADDPARPPRSSTTRGWPRCCAGALCRARIARAGRADRRLRRLVPVADRGRRRCAGSSTRSAGRSLPYGDRPGTGPGPGGRPAATPGRGAPRRVAGRSLAAPDGPVASRSRAFLDAGLAGGHPGGAGASRCSPTPTALAARRRRGAHRRRSRRCSPGRKPPRTPKAARWTRRRRGADRRGGRADRAAAELRARGGRRGAGPVPDAVPGHRPAQRARLAHPARRPGPGHRAVGGRATGAETLRHLGKPDAPVVPLTIGFRVPAAVVALANRLLPALGVDVPPAVSLRRDGALDVRAGRPTWTARRWPRCGRRSAHEGSVAVIAADAAVDRLRAALAAAGRRDRDRRRDRRPRRG